MKLQQLAVIFVIIVVPISLVLSMYTNKNTEVLRTQAEYNSILGVDTLHPLVSVIDLSTANPMRHMRHTFGFYAIFLKDEKNCELIYGRQRYDYQKGTVVCLAPGQVVGVEDTGEVFQPKGWALCFDAELIRWTSLGRNIREYTFFGDYLRQYPK